MDYGLWSRSTTVLVLLLRTGVPGTVNTVYYQILEYNIVQYSGYYAYKYKYYSR